MNQASPLRRNIEIKARCADLQVAAAAIVSLSPREGGTQSQTDTYFVVPHGRLKLREIAGQAATLIWYVRANELRSRKSDYLLIPTADPTALKTALAAALGVRIVVRKVRRILLWHNIRIHLDKVENLGTFVEFEAVMNPDDSESIAHDRLAELCKLMSIAPADYLETSYGEL